MRAQILSRLYSSEIKKKQNAVYRILFERKMELIPDLRQAALMEKNEEIAVLMAQVCLALEASPRDPSLERRILEFL